MEMKVTVRPHGYLISALGAKQLEVDLSQGSRLQDLLNQLGERYGQTVTDIVQTSSGAADRMPQVWVLINGQDCYFLGGSNTLLEESDQVDLVPPFEDG